ncbi:hypothetical protein BKA61DRAFT_607018 [Leptodontidium sp. MPI-SDFR-AT-0119]|nr:hypothetical protein BKA61DRAFT_607018 [Leptodontidium sp. MPI-SDFR-AT-0119]
MSSPGIAGSLRDLVDLAIKATDRLFECTRLCRTIKVQTARSFCRHLGAELLLLNGRLNDLLTPSEVSTKEISGLLGYLDRLCIWPSKSQSGQYPNLEFLVSSDGLATPIDPQGAITRLASSTHKDAASHRKEFLREFEYFCKEKDPGLSEILDTVRQMDLESEEKRDYSYHVRALYRALYAYRSCDGTNPSTEKLTFKLRLNGYEEDGEFLKFSMLFLPHPHSDSLHCPMEWQDTQVCVSLMQPRKERRVMFDDDEQDITPSTPSSPALETTEFCNLISNPQQSRLCMKVHGERLIFEEVTDVIDTVLNHPSVSLASLLSEESLTYRMRCCLSMIIARAVWQFYDSEWMLRDWTKDQVHFPLYLRTYGSEEVNIYASKPFLSARFDTLSEQKPVRGRIHKCPKILALGILLLEIELDLKIETKRLKKHLRADGQPTLNTDYIAAMDLYNNEQLWRYRSTQPAHKEVIGYCLKAPNFRGLTDACEEREALYKNVVIPLEKTFKNAWPNLDETPIKVPDTMGAMEVTLPRLEHPTERLNQPRRIRTPKPSLSPEAEAAKAWFESIEDMCSTLRRKRTTRERVKIAILDTGLDENHHPFWEVKKGYEDFAGNQNHRGIDDTGHGTNGFHLISKIMDDEVDIFVARVFEGEKATSETPTLMAKAIRHAIDKWQVDIITMSSGFEHEYGDLRQAVLEANAANTLIFAAASNWGNRGYIAFPARMHGNVMCIFSATADGKRSSFNPARSGKSTTNFAVLGEEVEKVQIDMDRHPGYDSGTSIATFIAAAIAALVIDFSRQQDSKEIILDPTRLKTVAGMKAIFAEMADGGYDGGYQFLVPQRVLECSKLDVKKRGLVATRKYIADTVSRALDRANTG